MISVFYVKHCQFRFDLAKNTNKKYSETTTLNSFHLHFGVHTGTSRSARKCLLGEKLTFFRSLVFVSLIQVNALTLTGSY